MDIQEGDIVGYSDLYLSTISTMPRFASGRRGIAGKLKTYPTKVLYREVLWGDLNKIQEVRLDWLKKI